jgi:hypothetical protein
MHANWDELKFDISQTETIRRLDTPRKVSSRLHRHQCAYRSHAINHLPALIVYTETVQRMRAGQRMHSAAAAVVNPGDT